MTTCKYNVRQVVTTVTKFWQVIEAESHAEAIDAFNRSAGQCRTESSRPGPVTSRESRA